MVAHRLGFTDDAEPPPPPAKRPERPWWWKPSRQPYTVIFGIMFALWLLVGVCELVATQLPERPVEVLVVDWILTCQVTHRGEAKADEAFSGQHLETLANRDGIFVDRIYTGMRVSSRVVVKDSQRGGPVTPGQYTLYGTITKVDVRDKRLKLTDCVFVPLPVVVP